MTDYIEISNGEARFAFNKHNGDPWHKLGTAVDGYGSIDEMLVAAQANWEVHKRALYIHPDHNDPVLLEDKHATVREEIILDADGFTTISTPLGVVGRNYAVEQNRSAAEWAYDLVGASGNDAIIDTMGVLRDGKEFFVGVDLGTLVLDPDGVADAIKKYLVVRNSHDGTMSLCAYPSNTRVVCWNTATMSLHTATRAKQVYKVRHTSGIADRKVEAVEAMNLANRIGQLFAEQAVKMMGITASSNELDMIINTLWSKPDVATATDRSLAAWGDRRSKIHQIFESDTCVGGFGSNGWTAWNAVTEYLDHSRPRVTSVKRAMAAMDADGAVAKAKDIAAQRVLSMV
jgi:phage/plasmid-like protein (TIGR03299 family)